MYDVYTHRKKIKFDDDGVIKGGKLNIFIFTEWKMIFEG